MPGRISIRSHSAAASRARTGISSAVSKSACLTLLLACLFSGPSPAQQGTPLTVTVKVVNVLATVRDKHGQIISNLAKDDFILEEDKRRQEVTNFIRDSDLPLTLGLLVDTSGSQRRVLDRERAASDSFLDDMLRDKDEAFVVHFDGEVDLLQEPTSDQMKLVRALGALDSVQPGGTLLYDAVAYASDTVIKGHEGRKALIILSDGVDSGSAESLQNAIMTTQRADTVVYSILFVDDELYSDPLAGFGTVGMGRMAGRGNYAPDAPDGRGVLERIAKESGGRLFTVSKKQPIDQIFRVIEEELRNQYSLGYIPASDAALGYHKLRLTTKQKDLIVQSRDGYYLDR